MTFYAFLNRMKYIERWSLMRNTQKENVMEHSECVAIIAHALAVIRNEVMGGRCNVEKTVLMAVLHEAGEVLTGDLPTPVKYFNAEIKDAYKGLERYASHKLLEKLPEPFRKHYEPYLLPDTGSDEYRLCKAADKIAAYVKCAEEVSGGNREFKKAKVSLKKDIDALKCPEADYFLTHFFPAFELTLDELE